MVYSIIILQLENEKWYEALDDGSSFRWFLEMFCIETSFDIEISVSHIPEIILQKIFCLEINSHSFLSYTHRLPPHQHHSQQLWKV